MKTCAILIRITMWCTRRADRRKCNVSSGCNDDDDDFDDGHNQNNNSTPVGMFFLSSKNI